MNYAQSRAVQRALHAPGAVLSVQTVINCATDHVIIPSVDGDWRLTEVTLTPHGQTFWGYRQTSQGRDAHPSGPRTFEPASDWDNDELRGRVNDAVKKGRGAVPGDVIDLLTDLRTELQ